MSNKFTGYQNSQSRDYVEDRDTKSQDTLYATSNGAPHPHPYGAQRAGENGPLLLQDFHLIDLLSHFDRYIFTHLIYIWRNILMSICSDR